MTTKAEDDARQLAKSRNFGRGLPQPGRHRCPKCDRDIMIIEIKVKLDDGTEGDDAVAVDTEVTRALIYPANKHALVRTLHAVRCLGYVLEAERRKVEEDRAGRRERWIRQMGEAPKPTKKANRGKKARR